MEYRGVIALKQGANPLNIKRRDIIFGTPFPTLKLITEGEGDVTFTTDGTGEGTMQHVIGTLPEGTPLPVQTYAVAEYYDAGLGSKTSYMYLMPQSSLSGGFGVQHDFNIYASDNQVIFEGGVFGTIPNESVSLHYKYYIYYDPF